MKLDFGTAFENETYYEINGYTVADTPDDLAEFTAWYFREDKKIMREESYAEDEAGYLDDWEGDI